MNPSALSIFQERKLALSQKLDHYSRLINRFSMARLGMIIGGGILLFKVIQTENVWATLFSFFVLFILFFWLVFKQSVYTKAKEQVEDDLLVVQNELDAAVGKEGIYSDGDEFINDAHAYSSDLDIFGRRSIYHQLNRAATLSGKSTLAAWLSVEATKEEIVYRQQAVTELANDPLWCLDFLGRAVFALKERRDFKKIFISYLNKPYADFGGLWLSVYVRISPWLILIALGLYAVFSGVFGQIATFLVVLNVLLAMGYAGKITTMSEGMGKMGRLLERFGLVLESMEGKNWESNRIRSLFLVKGDKGIKQGLSAQIRQLGKLINNLDYRLNVMIALFLNGFLLWDFRQVFAIIQWRKNHQHEFGPLFDELGEMEALVSLAMLKLHHPDWCFPDISAESKPVLQVRDMGHPLIPNAASVLNDYKMEGHRLALITGSNMAGKSTFLRTIGVNMVLAFCGAPVCAKEMEVSVRKVISYMRIRDSLKESTSTFKAELDRLEMILKKVARERETFFLVDEMLRGTNSVDKYLGSKAIIEKLIQDQGIGVVATHDLQLAELEATYPNYLKNFHFDIQILQGEMVFDYKLKEGACTIFNASILLKKIGVHISV